MNVFQPNIFILFAFNNTKLILFSHLHIYLYFLNQTLSTLHISHKNIFIGNVMFLVESTSVRPTCGKVFIQYCYFWSYFSQLSLQLRWPCVFIHTATLYSLPM
jgi:hypothetical protein